MPKWEAAHRATRNRSRHVSPARLGRFVSFDGEGFNRSDGSHIYALLQDSTGGRIEDWDHGLSSDRCFRFLVDATKRFGGRLCGVSYGFDYDVNNFLRDLPRGKLAYLHSHGEVKTGRWRLEWRPRKWFQVSELDPVTNRTIKGRSVRIYDTLGFYNVRFVDACADWVGKDDPDFAIVAEGKDRRSTFAPSDAEYMRRYNEAELRPMVRLTAKLKQAFDTAGIELTQFYGAGAAAGAFLTLIGFKRAINPEVPTEVRRAARHAYFGGRIEVPVYGNVPGPLHDYDLNSAYPSAALDLPNITSGRWVRSKIYRSELPFSLYHVRWNLPSGRPFYPFPWRAPDGAIFFPPQGQAWVWSPELTSALKDGGFQKRALRVLEAWHFIPDSPDDRPLAVLQEKYDLRKRFEREGNPAAKAIKLCLNAVYGKLAQSVSGMSQFGARDGPDRVRGVHGLDVPGPGLFGRLPEARGDCRLRHRRNPKPGTPRPPDFRPARGMEFGRIRGGHARPVRGLPTPKSRRFLGDPRSGVRGALRTLERGRSRLAAGPDDFGGGRPRPIRGPRSGRLDRPLGPMAQVRPGPEDTPIDGDRQEVGHPSAEPLDPGRQPRDTPPPDRADRSVPAGAGPRRGGHGIDAVGSEV
jgi:hypothetical protein